ncbi:MAG: flagellar hook assembly protein FlgD [Candidatus Zixiibacteriota bacterium]
MGPQSISSILAPQTAEQARIASDVLGKDDFLKMLTAQMQYQNPLEPMNDTEFIGQMTQFSSLEQLQNMNETMTNSAQWNMLLSQTINNTMATSLIGKTITADASVTAVSSDYTSPISFSSNGFALSGIITVYDAEGTAVRTIQVSQLQSGEHSIEWNGKDNNGNDLPAGNYGYTVDLKDAQGATVSASGFNKGVVTGVDYIEGQAYLLVNGGMIPLANVRHVTGG